MSKDGISKIHESDARQLNNQTVPIPGEPEYYIIGLDVFHQLHCLVSCPLRTSSIRILTSAGCRTRYDRNCGQTQPWRTRRGMRLCTSITALIISDRESCALAISAQSCGNGTRRQTIPVRFPRSIIPVGISIWSTNGQRCIDWRSLTRRYTWSLASDLLYFAFAFACFQIESIDIRSDEGGQFTLGRLQMQRGAAVVAVVLST